MNAVVTLAKSSRPSENGQVHCSASGGGEKENLIPPMLLAGLISTASKSKTNPPSIPNPPRIRSLKWKSSASLDLKLEGQFGVVEYSRITIPDSVHMGDPAGGYVDMLKARNSARGHLMAWNEKVPCNNFYRK